MLNLGAKSEAPDVTKLSDSELIAQLADRTYNKPITGIAAC